MCNPTIIESIPVKCIKKSKSNSKSKYEFRFSSLLPCDASLWRSRSRPNWESYTRESLIEFCCWVCGWWFGWLITIQHPPLIEEETNTRVNNTVSNGAWSAVRSHSVCGTDGDGTMTNCSTESAISPPTDMMDVLFDFSPTMIIVGAIYANKKALQRHLYRFAIRNHFQYKFKTLKNILHVVCLDDNCKWRPCHEDQRHKFMPN